MKRRGIVSLAIAGVLASAMSIAVSAPASASDLTYGLSNGSNSLCLQPINATQDAGAEVVQWPCNGRAEQRWVFHPVATPGGSGLCTPSACFESYQIDNELSRRCLDALGGATNGTRVVQWPCARINNQTWETDFLTGFPTVATMWSRVSGTFSHCLDVPGGQLSTVGLPMQIWGCNGTIAQKWILSPS